MYRSINRIPRSASRFIHTRGPQGKFDGASLAQRHQTGQAQPPYQRPFSASQFCRIGVGPVGGRQTFHRHDVLDTHG